MSAKSTNDFFSFPSVKFHKIWQISFHVTTTSFSKLKITNSSEVLVSSNTRASNNWTFYNV